MSLWERVKSWWTEEADQLLFAYLADGDALSANETYFRLWLSDMFLARSRHWGQNQWPAVHATVQLKFAKRDGAQFTRVARPPEGMLGDGVRQDYALTPLVPFSGGVVEIEGGLVELQGPKPLDAAIEVLQDFSGMVGAPLVTGLDVAQKVSNGVSKLLDSVQSNIVLGVYRSLVAAGGDATNLLRPGHLVVVRATASQVDDTRLSVRDSRLHLGDEPLEGYDYMVFRVESRRERDDYRGLFADLLGKATEAALGQDEQVFGERSRTLYVAVLTCEDLTPPDRQRIVRGFKAELTSMQELGLGAVPDGQGDVDAAISRGPSLDEVKVLPTLSVQDVTDASARW